MSQTLEIADTDFEMPDDWITTERVSWICYHIDDDDRLTNRREVFSDGYGRITAGVAAEFFAAAMVRKRYESSEIEDCDCNDDEFFVAIEWQNLKGETKYARFFVRPELVVKFNAVPDCD